ncbi:hypothetical protein [Ornithinimicrobium pratense]|uniref:Uncharacterized protein n=1 Tax=Ornithinimicrobium pratense TaxID=2593973 RepID=A0A5J6V3B7_9MICO|nr:hypothetical protein [Ornithinimicrobium pratense]QFG68430.1 hypothetical protein FY030_06625 [Ornithinimicrobium pratense]
MLATRRPASGHTPEKRCSGDRHGEEQAVGRDLADWWCRYRDVVTTPRSSQGPDDASRSSRSGELTDQAPAEARDLKETALGRGSEEELNEVQERWENRLAWPVLIAAIVSVPAVFLTLLDEPFEMIGHIGLWLVTAVLVFETAVLFLVSPQKIGWLRRNWWLVGLTGAGVLAVVFSIGPLQLFRVLRSVGALRVLRAKQMAKAGESLGKKGQSRWHQMSGKVLATLVVGAFVVIAMVDPDSEARVFLEDLVGEGGAIAAAVGSGLLTVIGMYFLVRSPQDQGEDSE